MNKVSKVVWSQVRQTRIVTGYAEKERNTKIRNGRQYAIRAVLAAFCLVGGMVFTENATGETPQNGAPVETYHYLSFGPEHEKNHPPEGNYNNDGARTYGAIAIGIDSVSEDADAISIGRKSYTNGIESIGIGLLANATGNYVTVVGHRAQAFGETASAYGTLARAYGANGLAIGTAALAAGVKPLTKAEFDALPEEQKAWYNTDKVNQKEFYQYRRRDRDGKIKDIITKGLAVGNYAESIGVGGVAVGDHAKSSDIDNVNDSNFGVSIGAYSQNKVAQGVALGTLSVSDRAGNKFGYLPTKNGIIDYPDDAMEAVGKGKEFTELKNEYTQLQEEMNAAKAAYEGNPTNTDLKTKYEEAKQKFSEWETKYAIMTAPWTSRKGAVSIGNDKKGQTRQIIGVAAGSEDTDAVNVAQLKALNMKVDTVAANSTAYTVETKENNDNTTTVTIKSNKAGDKGTTVTVATKDIHITSGTYDKTTKKLTFTTNTNTTFDVDMNDVINAAAEGSVHYLSVKSSETGEGSNYKNDGAVGENSIAIGNKAEAFHWGSSAVGNQAWSIGAFSQAWGWCAIASGEPGIDKETYDKLSEAEKKNYQLYSFLLDTGDKSLYYRTKYEEYTPEEYRALPADRQKALDKIGYQYSEARKKEIMAPRSLAIGIGARAVGKYTTAVGNWANATGIQATALGTQAKATGDFSIAAGDRAEARGGQSVAVGTQAKSDGVFSTAVGTLVQSDGALSTAVGVQAKSSGNQSIAMGYKAETVKGWSAAIGSGAKTQGMASTAVGGLKVSATVDYGAAFGSFSVAQREKGVSGYLANGQAGLAWKSNLGAFSVGDDVKGYSRQITGVAAGSKDSDAVNVAQLKVLNTKVDKVAANSTAYTVETKENNDNTTTVTIKSNKAGDKGTTVTVATKDIHITSGTYDKNTKKLTFTTNTNTTFDVDMNDVINAAAEGSVHYLSVKSSETGEGSNYKNDGAKAKGSIVLGVRSSSEGINGVVVGNDNKLTGIKNDQNNSVVIGTGLNVDGVHNIVIGTNYENYDQKETKVKGEHNTVIGNGNLVGYTAVKDPDDATKWKYTEVSTSGSDVNVVVGSCNTANGSSVAVGTSLEVENLGRAFGSGNKVIGSDNGGGQWGLALGSNNTVKGEMAVSVGTGTNASGDYTVSIGSDAKTNASNSIAMGYKAETVKGWSAAIGSGAKTEGTASTAVGGFNALATVDYGAAFGSFSVAQRASGVAGYLANGQKTIAWQSNLGAFSVGDDVKGFSRQITGVAAGSKDSDAVNVAQLKAIEKKIGTNGKDGKSAYDIWLETQTDKTKTKQDFLDSLKGKDGKDGTGADIDIAGDTESGVSVTPNTDNAGKKTYTIGLSTKIKAGEVTIDGTKDKEHVTVGDVQINGEKGKGTITGLSNTKWDGQRIVSGRAATEDQLQQATKTIQHHMAEMGQRVDCVGAKSAALAALHPLDYDADDKWDFSAAVGNYNGASSVALGAFYRPNERTMISMGGTVGGEDNMVNLGVSFKTGSGVDGQVYTSRTAMAKEIKALKEKDAQREEQLRKLIALVTAMQHK